MDEKKFRIVIAGIAPNNSPGQVIADLGHLFKTDFSKFQSLASGGQITVSSKADRNKAYSYKIALEKIGCIVLITPVPKQSGTFSKTTFVSKHSKMACPKCNYVRKPTDSHAASECPNCGIIYEKFTKSRSVDNANEKINIASTTLITKEKHNHSKTNKKVYLFVIAGVLMIGTGLRSCGRSANIGGMENVHGMGENALAVMMLIFGLGLIAIGIQRWFNPNAVEKAQKAENDLLEKRRKNLPRYFIISVFFLVTYFLGAILKLLDIKLGSPCFGIGYIGTILYGYKILPFVHEKGAMRSTCSILLFVPYLNFFILGYLTILLPESCM